MDRLLLIDGYSIINRAFYGVPMLNNKDGVPTNAVYGFLSILFKTLELKEFTHIAVAFDVKRPTFRHEMYDAYKGTRKPMPEELTMQVPMLKELLTAMNVRCLELPGFEADDILGTMARRGEAAGMEVCILSGDRDLLQIATKNTSIIIPKTQHGKTETFIYDEDGVKELYGVTPTQFIDMKALMGDSSDNIPGLPGVGEKTAGALIAAYGSIENCLDHISEIKPNKAKIAFEDHYDLAVLSKKLATICTDAPVEADISELVRKDFATRASYDIIMRYHFKSLINKFTPAEDEAKEDISIPAAKEIDDFSLALSLEEKLIKQLDNGKLAAVQSISAFGQYQGMAIALSSDELYYMPVGIFTNEFWQKELIAKLSVRGVVTINARNIYDQLEGDDRFAELNVKDVHIGAYLFNPLTSAYGPSEIAYSVLGLSIPSDEVLFDKKTFKSGSAAATEAIKTYLVNSAYVAYNAYPLMLKQLENNGLLSLYTDMELPLSYALYRCEQKGIILQKDEMKAYSEKLAVGIAELEKKIYDAAGEEFNINSPKQLGEILFDKLKIPGGKKTKTGYSTSAEVLEKLSEEHPFVRDILDYRQLSKLKSTYADALSEYVAEDGRIHCRFHQTITATGRISCSDPNLQNIPVRMELGREIRKLFVPKDGCIFIDADYSQIELRVLAHMSADKELLKAYHGASDIHAATAAAVFHVPIDEVTPELRRKAKAVNFGIVYGISSFGLSEDLSISRKEAEEIKERYFESYPGVKDFLDGLVSSAKANGVAKTMYGRIRPIPELKASQYMQRMFGERVAMNSPIQGTAADIMKLAMLRTENELKKRNLKSAIVLQVHDELLLECPVEEAEEIKQLLVECMRDSFDLDVPLEISISEGKSWYETK